MMTDSEDVRRGDDETDRQDVEQNNEHERFQALAQWDHYSDEEQANEMKYMMYSKDYWCSGGGGLSCDSYIQGSIP